MNGFSEFLRFCNARGLEYKTVKGYTYHFDRFCRCYDETILCSTINMEHIYAFIEYLKKVNPLITNTTINTNIRNIRVIFYYFMDKGYTKPFKIRLGKANKKIIEIYSQFELDILTEQPDIRHCTFEELRNWAVVNFELSTGARSSTTINIKIKDINFEEEIIIFRKTKNRKEQIIPMSGELIRVLKEYLKLQNRKVDPDDYLFCSGFNTQLTVGGLHTAIGRYNKNRGIKKTSVKLFRNTFAVNYLLNGGDVFRLQELMGHSDISVTKEYVYFTREQLRANIETINPLDVLKAKNHCQDKHDMEENIKHSKRKMIKVRKLKY